MVVRLPIAAGQTGSGGYDMPTLNKPQGFAR